MLLLFVLGSCSGNGELHIVIPNYYKGEITIIEDRSDYDNYDARAKELDGSLVYFVNDDHLLKLKRFNLVDNWESVTFSYEHVAPVDMARVSLKIIDDKTVRFTFK